VCGFVGRWAGDPCGSAANSYRSTPALRQSEGARSRWTDNACVSGDLAVSSLVGRANDQRSRVETSIHPPALWTPRQVGTVGWKSGPFCRDRPGVQIGPRQQNRPPPWLIEGRVHMGARNRIFLAPASDFEPQTQVQRAPTESGGSANEQHHFANASTINSEPRRLASKTVLGQAAIADGVFAICHKL